MTTIETMTKTQNETYLGWTNYETWNVALWLQNHTLAYEAGSYEDFLEIFKEMNIIATPDGVKYNDPNVNIIELNSELFDY